MSSKLKTVRLLLVTLGFLIAAIASAGGPAEPATPESFHTTDPQLRSLVEALLLSNPGVQSAWADSRSRYDRVVQVVSLPDPTIAYRYFADTPETRVGPQEHALELSQGIPWTGKRRLQGEQARLMADGSSWRASGREREEVAKLKKAYFEAAYLQEAHAVLREERALLERFEQIALTRYSTGKGIQQSAIKVQTAISRLDEKEFALLENLAVVGQRVADLVGQPGPGLVLAPITLPFPRLDIDAAELASLAAARHPEVRAAEKNIEAGQTRARRRALENRPDFKIGLGYTLVGSRDDPAGILNPPADNGDDILGVTVGVTLPVYRKRIRAGIAEAEQVVDRDRHALAAVRSELSYQVHQAATRMGSIGERGRLYEAVIIPQAEQALASAEAAYSTGGLGFLDLLDAERILFQSRLAFHRLVSDFWIAASGLEESIGRPFPSIQGEP